MNASTRRGNVTVTVWPDVRYIDTWHASFTTRSAVRRESVKGETAAAALVAALELLETFHQEHES